MRKIAFLFSLVILTLSLNTQAQNFPLTSKYDRNICFDDSKEGYQESVKYFTKIIAEFPDDTSAYYNIGMSYYKLLDFPKAIEYFSQLIEIDSCYSGAFYNRAICKIFTKDSVGACNDFEKALRCDNTDGVETMIKQEYDKFCK